MSKSVKVSAVSFYVKVSESISCFIPVRKSAVLFCHRENLTGVGNWQKVFTSFWKIMAFCFWVFLSVCVCVCEDSDRDDWWAVCMCVYQDSDRDNWPADRGAGPDGLLIPHHPPPGACAGPEPQPADRLHGRLGRHGRPAGHSLQHLRPHGAPCHCASPHPSPAIRDSHDTSAAGMASGFMLSSSFCFVMGVVLVFLFFALAHGVGWSWILCSLGGLMWWKEGETCVQGAVRRTCWWSCTRPSRRSVSSSWRVNTRTLWFQGTTIVEEEDIPVILRQVKQKECEQQLEG